MRLKFFHEIWFFSNKTLEYKALLVEVYMHKSSSICSAFRKQEQEEPATYIGGERDSMKPQINSSLAALY